MGAETRLLGTQNTALYNTDVMPFTTPGSSLQSIMQGRYPGFHLSDDPLYSGGRH